MEKPKRSASGSRRVPRAKSGHDATESHDLFSQRPPQASAEEPQKEAAATASPRPDFVLVPVAMLVETYRRLHAALAELNKVDVRVSTAMAYGREQLRDLIEWYGPQAQLAGVDVEQLAEHRGSLSAHPKAEEQREGGRKDPEDAEKQLGEKAKCGRRHPSKPEVRCAKPKGHPGGVHEGEGDRPERWIGTTKDPEAVPREPEGGKRRGRSAKVAREKAEAPVAVAEQVADEKEPATAQHTPGPWKVKTYASEAIILAGAAEKAIGWTERDRAGTTKGEADANAKLMAAAPAMKDFLLEMLGDIRGMEDTPHNWGILARWEMKAGEVLGAAGVELPGKEVRHAE